MKVFLGGTCNGSLWRNAIIPYLNIDFFNPVVEDWTPECQEREIEERENCDICLYLITPMIAGVYSIAEVVDDSNKRPGKTVFAFIPIDGDKQFTECQIKSLKMVGRMVTENGGVWVDGKWVLELVVEELNRRDRATLC
jgi:hypothetical protein